jgi:hypothetical protein
MEMGSLFAFIGIGAGVYCLSSFIMMVTKHKVDSTIILPKDAQFKKCKDIDAYVKEMTLPLLVLTLVLLFAGVCEIVNAYYMPLGIIIFIVNVIEIVTLLGYAYVAKKINRKYYGI